MRCNRTAAAALLVAAVAACQPQPVGLGGPVTGRPEPGMEPRSAGATSSRVGGLSLHAHAPVYAAGREVTLVLTNESAHTAYGSLCNAVLERATGDGWEAGLAGSATASCGPIATPVPPNGRVRQMVGLPPELPVGRYRFRVDVDVGDAGQSATLLSNTFMIR